MHMLRALELLTPALEPLRGHSMPMKSWMCEPCGHRNRAAHPGRRQKTGGPENRSQCVLLMRHYSVTI